LEHLIVNKGHGINVDPGAPRGFSRLDFNEIKSSGTFRNLVSALRAKNAIYVLSRGIPATYAVRGTGLKAEVTLPPTVGGRRNARLEDLLLSLREEVACVHDMHITFACPHFYDRLQLVPDKSSRDKRLTVKQIGLGRTLGVTAHKSGTVSVRVGCSMHPFPRDNLSELFFILEEVRQDVMTRYLMSAEGVPLLAEWIVNAWEYNKDGGAIRGPRFEITLAGLSDTLYRIYSKRFQGVTRARLEKKETPRRSLRELAREALMA